MSNKTAKLTVADQATELPVLKSHLGNEVIDVSRLGQTGRFTFDPGFKSTAACESKITYIDGANGVLLYRGYPIEQLAEKIAYQDVCYLLMNGELPDQTQSQTFQQQLNDNAAIDATVAKTLHGFGQDAHPMAMLSGLVSALAGSTHQHINLQDEHSRRHTVMSAVSKVSTLAAMCYRHQQGLDFIPPHPDYSYAENFLHMMFAEKSDSPRPNPVLAKALDRILTLHADHEQNASTSTVRLAGSTGTNPYAALAAGIAALWGPAHGGANEAALNMLREIDGEENIERYVEKAKDKNDPFRLMGFGHRVYKNYDPRAKVMQATCHDVLNELGCHDDPTLKAALKLEKIALEDPYFIERKLYPNIDFYSGITLDAIGFPPSMFTVIFALARTVGWMSHWLEMLADPHHVIGRPRQRYMGHTQRDI